MSQQTYVTLTTTTATVTYAVAWTKAVDPKEARRRARIRKWHDDITAKQKIWFDAEMKRIEEDCAANDWRPRVSNSKTENPFELAWWSLGRMEDESDIEKEGGKGSPFWREQRNAYNRMWTGLTVSNASLFEQAAIDQFIAGLRKKEFFMHTEEWQDHEPLIGSHKTKSSGFWFKNLDDHNRFVDILDALPKRTQMMLLGKAGDVKAIRHLLKSENHAIVVGDCKVALTMPEGTNAVLAKMFVG